MPCVCSLGPPYNWISEAFFTRILAAIDELAVMIPRCRTDQFCRSFLPAVIRLWNLLPLGVFSIGTWSFFKSAMNLCLLRA